MAKINSSDMNDIIKVSISGIAFILDEQAFKNLDHYLKKLEKGYKNNPDGREILADIEARIAEIILAKQGSDSVVCKERVNEIIEQLGIPDELQSEQDEPVCDNVEATKSFPRRLYRNPEGAKLGGVCSGLGNFFEMDPVWIRLAIFVPLLLATLTAPIHIPFVRSFFATTFAAFVLCYIVLWFAIPIARTPRQRLEMRGKKITASSIHNNFQEDFLQMSGNTPCGRKSASVLAELVYVLGRILLFGVKLLALLIGFAFAIGAIVLLVMFFTLLLGNMNGEMEPLIQMLQISGMSTATFMALLALVALTPLALATYLLLRLVFNLPANRIVLSAIALLWLALSVYVGCVGVKNFNNIKHGIELVCESNSYDSDDSDDYYDSDSCDVNADAIITEGIIEGDSTRSDSVVIKIIEHSPVK